MSGAPRRAGCTYIVVAVLLLLLLSRALAERAPTRSLLRVVKPSMSATSRLHALVRGYQHDPYLSSDVQSQALLSDCAELTSTSTEALRSIIVQLRSFNGTARSQMDDLRTSLSAALTDITTCTDELHDELPPQAPKEMKKAVKLIEKQASRASKLLSKAVKLVSP